MGLATLVFRTRRHVFRREQLLPVEQATERSSTKPPPGAPARTAGLESRPSDTIEYDIQCKKLVTAQLFSELFADTREGKLP